VRAVGSACPASADSASGYLSLCLGSVLIFYMLPPSITLEHAHINDLTLYFQAELLLVLRNMNLSGAQQADALFEACEAAALIFQLQIWGPPGGCHGMFGKGFISHSNCECRYVLPRNATRSMEATNKKP
ncbi:hypothetical protein CEXT_227761, partial [Caerostris extrusa]